MGKNKWLKKVKEWIEQERPGEKMIFYSAAMEAKLLDMEEAERAKFLEDNKTVSQIAKIVSDGYHTLQLIHFYTAGPDECRCWTIRDGWLAPKAAGTIHTDCERGGKIPAGGQELFGQGQGHHFLQVQRHG